jgi:osomolarity two-component system response regulator SKN7
MNDVLPKPFTKEGMLKALQKHLPGFLKDAQPPSHSQYQNQAQLPHPGGGFSTPGSAQPPLGLNMGQLSAAQSLKDETSPGKSPATASSWHSPNQIPGQSPIGNGSIGFIQQQPMQQPMRDHHYGAMTPTHPHPQTSYPPPPNTPLGPPRGPPHKRVMSDMTGGPEEHPDNRRRIYTQNQPGYQQ